MVNVEKLIEVLRLLREAQSRWDWELHQAETARLQGDEQHFLRAKAGFRCTQDAIEAVECIIGDATGWPNLFPDPSAPEQQQ